MTSAKYYGNWLKEAGRGHLSAILSWGGFTLYLIFKIMSLSIDTDFAFFGIGSMELRYLCMGLGILMAFSEFNYLFQPKKLDFYYSLPVKKNTIFWMRYIHGALHFAGPLLITQAILAVYQASRDSLLAYYVSSYTLHSVIVFLLIFLLFYHAGLLAIVVAGRASSAVAILAVLLFYCEILVQYALLGISKEIFRTFYRIPLLERAGEMLAPARLSDILAGTFLYEKREVLEYVPGGMHLSAAAAWILALGIAAFLVFGRRKTEMTGRALVNRHVERAVEILASVLAGISASVLVLKAFHSLGDGGLKSVLCLLTAGLAATILVHLLLEWLLQPAVRKVWRRKGQLAAEGIAVCALALAFFGARGSFDGFCPQLDRVEELSISMNGVDMGQAQYEEIAEGKGSYLVDRQLTQYSMRGEGKQQGLDWLRGVSKQEGARKEEAAGGQDSGKVTTVTACYKMKGGARKYRTYPVDAEGLEAFASVYECSEYKEKAYPMTGIEEADKERLIWSDGVLEQTLGLSAQDKRELLAAYKKDIESLKLKNLKESLPAGYIELESEVSGKNVRAAIYPFFARTCGLLREHGADVGKQIEGYKVAGLKVKNLASGAGRSGASAGVRFYQEEEDLKEWQGRLVPEELAIQPILHPVDGQIYAEAEIEDEDTGSVSIAHCYGKTK